MRPADKYYAIFTEDRDVVSIDTDHSNLAEIANEHNRETTGYDYWTVDLLNILRESGYWIIVDEGDAIINLSLIKDTCELLCLEHNTNINTLNNYWRVEKL